MFRTMRSGQGCVEKAKAHGLTYRWTKEECRGKVTSQIERWTLPGWETKALRKGQASWKQPLAEAATKTGPLAEVAARLHQLGADENALWLTTNEGPECVPLDDMEFRINARVRLDLPVIQQGLCQHQRRQKSDGTAKARCLAQLDEQGQHARRCLIGGDRAKLHDVGCHIIHNACCEAGLKSQREVIVLALVTDRFTEPRVDVDAWGHAGLPHIRLDFTVVDAEAIHVLRR